LFVYVPRQISPYYSKFTWPEETLKKSQRTQGYTSGIEILEKETGVVEGELSIGGAGNVD
jgi:hypothetical protein